MHVPAISPPVFLVFYVVASRLAMRHFRGAIREIILALLSLTGVFVIFFYAESSGLETPSKFFLYLAIVVFQYLVFRTFAKTGSRASWIAFFFPIAFLIVAHYVPPAFYFPLAHLVGKKGVGIPNFIGLSYLAFRCSRLVLEVRNGSVARPGLWEYLNFAFFLPTMAVGPINTYSNHRRGFDAQPWAPPMGKAAMRVLVGLIKFQFLGAIFAQFTYTSFLLDLHLHYWFDLPIAMAFYYLYLYCNFSGACDMAIGAAALIGIPVLENFNNPFAARNIKDFWNRWHITLSQWMRDIVFAPLSKFLVRVMGAPMANHAIAIAITVVFLLVGIWHGVGWNYVLFGLFHALGLVANHYYTIALKQRLGRDGFKAYMENRWIHYAAVVVTFAWCAASLMFFANTLSQIHDIFQILR